MIWKEILMAGFKVLYQHSLEILKLVMNLNEASQYPGSDSDLLTPK
jgi:hypothetical protein